MLIKNKPIAIVGGGPGGLTLARLLQLKGADVKVYERDLSREARVQGSSLDLHQDSGLKALGEAGLMDVFKANYRPGADKMRITDKQGNILFDDHEEEKAEDFGDESFRPEIDRGPLRNLLLDALLPGTVVWNSHLESLEPEGHGWRLRFTNGSSSDADIVIGADGANSGIRPIVTSIKPFYSGVTIVEGSLYDPEVSAPSIYNLLKGGKIFAMGDSRTLIVSSKGDGSMSFYTGCKTDESWVHDCGIDFKDKSQLLEWFRQEYSEWGVIWQELFASSKTSFVPRPQYCMPLDQTWEALPNITLLGDAAHLMPPYAGEGVNMAMLDALVLSRCLTGGEFSDVRSAIAAYENEMRERASRVADDTLKQTDLLHSPGALFALIEMFSDRKEE